MILFEGFCLVCSKFGAYQALRKHPCVSKEDQSLADCEAIEGWLILKLADKDWLLLRERRR